MNILKNYILSILSITLIYIIWGLLGTNLSIIEFFVLVQLQVIIGGVYD